MEKLVVLASLGLLVAAINVARAEDAKSPLDFKVTNIDGKPVDLADYKGKVILVVNVASQCGNTPQYKGLEELYKKYQGKGFVVLGFPANEFARRSRARTPRSPSSANRPTTSISRCSPRLWSRAKASLRCTIS